MGPASRAKGRANLFLTMLICRHQRYTLNRVKRLVLLVKPLLVMPASCIRALIQNLD